MNISCTFTQRLITLILTVLSLVSSSCSDKKAKTIGEPIAIVRLDHIYADYATLDPAEQQKIFTSDSSLIVAQMQIMGVDSAGITEMRSFCSSDIVKVFTAETAKVFGKLESEEQILGNIVVRIAEEGIELPSRKYASTVWGLSKSIVVTDKAVFIALNHYLGAKHPAYDGWPEFQRASKRRDMIPYDITEALLAIEHPYRPQNKESVLSRLLYEGVLTYAKMRILDEPTLANALGYNAEQVADIESNRSFIWERLLKDNLLHSTDQAIIDKLFSTTQVCSIISPDAPGRCVRIIGYDIVCSWLNEHPGTTLDKLLSPSFYDSSTTLTEAKYSPQNSTKKS